MNKMPFFIRQFLSAILIFLAALAVLTTCELSDAQESFPPPRGMVNDFAGVISPADAARMETISREVLEKTGVSVVVATFPSIGDKDLNDYVNRLYQAWGIGKKGEDRGLLIFLALRERQIRIETGYGLEGILPDGRVGGILDENVIPYLKKGDYSLGLVKAVTAVSLIVAGEAGVTLTGDSISKPSSNRRELRNGGNFWLWFIILLIISLLGTRRGREYLPLILMMLLSSRRGGGGGGELDGFGGFGGGFGGFGGGSSGGGGASRGF